MEIRKSALLSAVFGNFSELFFVGRNEKGSFMSLVVITKAGFDESVFSDLMGGVLFVLTRPEAPIKKDTG